MKMINPTNKKLLYLLFPVVILLAFSVYVVRQPSNSIQEANTKPSEKSFQAPGKDWSSEKKVEDYFVEKLGMNYEDAKNARKPSANGKIMLRVRENTTLEALISNLEYYGFVRDQEALLYALEHTEDTQEGKADPIMVSDNKTISIWSYYRISEDMTAWEIADELLNHPTYFGFDEYNKMFMPLP